MTEGKPWWDFEPQDLRELGLKVLTNRSIDTSRVFFQSAKFLFLGLVLLLGSRDLSKVTVAAPWEELLRLFCMLVKVVAFGYIASGVIVLVTGYLWLNLFSQWACIFAFDAIARCLLGMVTFGEAFTNLVRAVLVTGALDLAFRLWESRRRDVPIRWRLEVFCRVVGLASALVWAAWFWRFSSAPEGGGNGVSARISELWPYRRGGSEPDSLFRPYPFVDSVNEQLALFSTSVVFGVVTAYQIRSGKGYAARHLSFPDYLDEQQTIVGFIMGSLADRLGVVGVAEEGDVDKLLAGRHPRTGDVLRERAGTKNSVAANDFVVSAPKSVSLMSRVDDRIEPLFDQTAKVTMVEFLQLHVDTRVRVNGANELRPTGEFLAVAYLHDTSRALDPQLHVHFVVPNLTWDEVEGKYKAMHAKRMYEALPLATEHFRSALADGLKQLGYETEPNFDKNGKSLGFEIKGVPATLREKFSQRSKDRDKGVEALEAEKGRELTGSEVAVIVRGTRQPKLTKISKAEVRARQEARMTAEERALLDGLRDEAQARVAARELAAREAVEKVSERTEVLEPERVEEKVRGVAPEEIHAAGAGRLAAVWEKAVELWKGWSDRHTVLSLEYAKEHVFERLSVAKADEVIVVAMGHGRGKTSYEKLERLLDAQIERGDVVQLGGLIATKETLLREQNMIDNINRGVGKHLPLAWPGLAPRPMMAEEQAAIDSVLNSADRVVAVQGAAGTRTAAVLAAIQDGVRSSGKEVTTVTPTGASMDVLKRAGVKDAIAMGRFTLLNQRSWMEVLTEKAQRHRGHVVLVDQASLISSKQMADFLELTERLDCRVVLMGDARQMRSVEAGDAFRLLQKDSELKTFRVTAVVQQKGSLRSALSTLREDPTLGFMKLSRMGVINEVREADLFKAAAEEYVSLLGKPNSRGKSRSVLGISPTRAGVLAFNNAVRDLLRAAKVVTRERAHKTLNNLYWTMAEKRETRNYKAGLYLNFHKATKHVKKGETFKVRAVIAGRIIATRGLSRVVAISKKQAACFNVFEKTQVQVGKGDRLLLQQSMKSDAGRLFSFKSVFKANEIVKVKGHDLRGRIVLDDGRVLPHDYQQFAHGWAVTPNRAQGRQVDSAVVAAGRMTREGFYVAASRGTESLSVFTPNEEKLAESVAVRSDRMAAIELAREIERKSAATESKQATHSLGAGRSA